MDPDLVDKITHVDGATGAILVTLGVAIYKVHARLIAFEETSKTQLNSLRASIVDVDHKLELAAQKITHWLEHLRGDK